MRLTRGMIRIAHVCILLISFCSCKNASKQLKDTHVEKPDTFETIQVNTNEVQERLDTIIIQTVLKDLSGVSDTTFVNLKEYSDDFLYDLKYATTDNFLKTKVYECAECYVRAKTARALIKANKEFQKQGYRIKFFDCYRPHDVQKEMWKIVPNPQYVANPAKGSIHNKGGAVDITLVNSNGEELKMGTGFDFFGPKAHHDYTALPEKVLENRKLLKETMEKYGFWSIRTEWWHYNLSAGSNDRVANFRWNCE
ncbi:D-alanyl-D-alanine dipeptidase [Zhouia amylolytica]|uniref:D-alanyl-D-alanine dipeptidase n=1 Tax=Zhouia amylolytica TaxID=376730 RepID=A0A1I6VJD7_9FLAO|nr:M15 family metallopeptidase [Zhouia amylolytica]SFT13818.1 D-alanyl-D-alanine dipeptidase [Zhouia amylolytica]